MTDKQPEALRLAEQLDGACNGPLDFKHKAATELRRLHEVNAELVVVLRWLNARGGLSLDVHEQIDAVLDKATGEQQ
mgnify:CR=1 FL=1